MPKAKPEVEADASAEVAPAAQEPAAQPVAANSVERLCSEILTGSLADGNFKPLRWTAKSGTAFGIGSKFGELTFENGEVFESPDRKAVETLIKQLRAVRPNDDIRLTITK